jgi:hypothetical protein
MCEFYKDSDCEFRKDGLCTKYKSTQDGLSLHCSGVWAENKIGRFKYYAEMFSTGMKNKWPHRYYLDLFSGPGRCIIRENKTEINGSCIEAANLKDKFTKYYFIDKNPECINILKNRIGERDDVKLIDKDCNLAIIDPDSLQFNFDTYSYLSNRRIDLIVNYPIGPIERAIASVNKRNFKSQVLDSFHPGWKNIMAQNSWGNSKEVKIRNLINDYIKKVEELGYFSSGLTPFKNKKNCILYYLIAFSKDPKGIEFWKKVNLGFLNRGGQKALFDI